MKKFFYIFTTVSFSLIAGYPFLNGVRAQVVKGYVAPQDSALMKRKAYESLNSYNSGKGSGQVDSRLLGAAVKASAMLKDTAAYDRKKGLPITALFNASDLTYFANSGINTVVSLFEQINTHLPKNERIDFVADTTQTVSSIDNPLVLKNLRMKISQKPGSLNANPAQWQENVYLAYMARDYGTKLNNTITITSATREMRESPDLELIDFDGKPVTLAGILKEELMKTSNSAKAEKLAVTAFRMRTFPNTQMTKENANENYRRALLKLIDLQEGDFNRHPETSDFIVRLRMDLAKGKNSSVISALKASSFFDANVPGNVGPVLLTDDQLLNPGLVSEQANARAMELITLTALHYGERDAVKLLGRLIGGEGSLAADQTKDFTPKRLGELKFHGVEKFKSLGFGSDKTTGMTMSDLVLVAVASPEVPVVADPNAALTLINVGKSVVNQYSTVRIEENKHTFQLNPRILLGTRHIEYRSSFDAVEYVPELLNGSGIDQRGSRVTQNGLELRLESDIYFSNLKKMYERGLKPVIYPEFGILLGAGRRKVGYDNSTTVGQHGEVPRFTQRYLNWGSHAGLNLGPVMVGLDATILSTSSDEDPYKRFFDLSQGMTYFRYTMLVHVFNFGLRQRDAMRPVHLTFDLEVSGETNNEGTLDRTTTQNGSSQTGSREWQLDYDRAHPNGQYDHTIATQMILNGDVKAAYAASNFAAMHAGLEKSGFRLRLTAGLYNLTAIKGHDESRGEWIRQLFKNTAKGNLFGAVGLSYSFGSRSTKEKYTRSERQQSGADGLMSDPQVEESTVKEKSSSSALQNRAVFSNRKK